jgi:hypothetical protein
MPAAPMHSVNASRGLPWPSDSAISTIPANATTMPASWVRRARSRSITAANIAVNSACVCSTSEDRPAGMPMCMLMNSSPNWPTPSGSPMSRNQRQGMAGRRTNRMAGKAAATKRRPAKSSGGSESRPTSMTTKFTPQMAAIITAAATWRGFIWPMLA